MATAEQLDSEKGPEKSPVFMINDEDFPALPVREAWVPVVVARGPVVEARVPVVETRVPVVEARGPVVEARGPVVAESEPVVEAGEESETESIIEFKINPDDFPALPEPCPQPSSVVQIRVKKRKGSKPKVSTPGSSQPVKPEQQEQQEDEELVPLLSLLPPYQGPRPNIVHHPDGILYIIYVFCIKINIFI